MTSTTIVVGLIFSLIWIIPTTKIISKAGYSGWWFLVMFIPVVNLIMLWVFAFARWPGTIDRTRLY